MKKIQVRFVERRGLLSVLEVITPEAGFAVRSLGRVLEVLRVQVVRWETRFGAGPPIERLSIVEYDGGPVGERRRLQVQAEVLAAIEQMLTVGGLPAPLSAHIERVQRPLRAKVLEGAPLNDAPTAA